MDLLPKIAFILGMSIAVTIFGVFLYAAVPDIIRNNNWEEIAVPIDEKALLEKFHTNEAYLIFIEKYPENGETFRNWGDGGELKINAMNFTSLTTVELELNYSTRDNYFRQDVDCRNDQYDWRLRIQGPLTAAFLEKVDCLAIETFTGKSVELIDYDGEPQFASDFLITID